MEGILATWSRERSLVLVVVYDLSKQRISAYTARIYGEQNTEMSDMVLVYIRESWSRPGTAVPQGTWIFVSRGTTLPRSCFRVPGY